MSFESFSGSGSGSTIDQGSQPSQQSIGSAPEDLLESPPVEAEDSLHCEKCKKTLKTVRGFKAHKARHIQEDHQSRISPEILISMSSEKAEDTLKAILKDPFVGSIGVIRESYLQNLATKTNNRQWAELIHDVSTDFVDIIFSRKKILPAAQHEENVKAVKQWLFNNHQKLIDLLNKVCVGETPVLRCVLYRFCTKFFESLEIMCVQLMRNENTYKERVERVRDFCDDEKQALIYAAGSVLRGFIWKAKKIAPNNATCKERLKCINAKFLFDETEEYSEEFLRLKLWLDSVNRGGLVVMNEKIYRFFLGVEGIVRCLSTDSTEIKYEDVIAHIYKTENEDLLSLWEVLTALHLSESSSVLFLEQTVMKYVHFSGKAEVYVRLRQLEEKNHLQKVALRTDFKRN